MTAINTPIKSKPTGSTVAIATDQQRLPSAAFFSISHIFERLQSLQGQTFELIPNEVKDLASDKSPIFVAAWKNLNNRPIGQLAVISVGLKLAMLSLALIVVLWPAISAVGNMLFFAAIAFTLLKLALVVLDSSKTLVLPFLLDSGSFNSVVAVGPVGSTIVAAEPAGTKTAAASGKKSSSSRTRSAR